LGTATSKGANERREQTMSARKDSSDHRRFRLAANDNETVINDDFDTEGHRLAANDSEITVEDLRRRVTEEDDDPMAVGRAPELSNH
jgi:hypothetical protein